jgi:hypothetical protein
MFKVVFIININMSKFPKLVTIKKHNYFIVNDIYKYNKEYFYGCSGGVRKIVLKKQIPEIMYIYAYIKDNKWIVSDSSYPKAKLLLNSVWVYKNIPGITKNKNIESDESSDDESDESDESSDESGDESNIESSDDNESKNIIKFAPPVLELKDEEKFIDENDEILEIDVRGVRDPEKCYFRASDISCAFDIQNIANTLLKSTSSFEPNVHYTNFISKSLDKKSKKILYLTFYGLVKLLFVSRSKSAEHFQKWAYKNLFIVQMGTSQSKQKLASKLLGTTPDIIKIFIKSTIESISCVYLFMIGIVKNLRESMNIDEKYDDDDIVLKYGMTGDLLERTGDHEKLYGSLEGANFQLIYQCHIDPIHISKAETFISKFFNLANSKYKYIDNKNKKHTEIIIVTKKFLRTEIKEKYTELNSLYGGKIKEVNSQIDKLIIENKLASSEFETKIEKFKNKLLKKDLEIMKLKNKLKNNESDSE